MILHYVVTPLPDRAPGSHEETPSDFRRLTTLLTLSSNFIELFHSLFWIELKRSVGVKGLILLMFFVFGIRPLSALDTEKQLYSDCPAPGICGGGARPEVHGIINNITLNKKVQHSTSLSQCLFLNQCTIREICQYQNDQFRQRVSEIKKYRLKFCGAYDLIHVISKTNMIQNVESTNCESYLGDIARMDAEIEEAYLTFLDLLNKFDCASYSSVWICKDCKVGSILNFVRIVYCIL